MGVSDRGSRTVPRTYEGDSTAGGGWTTGGGAEELDLGSSKNWPGLGLGVGVGFADVVGSALVLGMISWVVLSSTMAVTVSYFVSVTHSTTMPRLL